MAITISNANANISDSVLTYAITFSGRVTGSSTGYVTVSILVNGVTIATASSTTATSTLNATYTASNLYTNAQGSSLSGAVTFRVSEFDTADNQIGTSSRTGGNITINARCSGLNTTSPTSGAPINLDLADPANVVASWARPHTAFRARLKGYVYNGTSYVQVFNRYGYTTSASFDVVSLGYKDAMVAAMNNVSPRNFRLELYTQFDDGTADYIDLGSVNDTDTITNGVTYTFVTLSTISISNFTLSSATTAVPFTLTKYGSYSHTVKLYANGTLIRTETGVTASGNFTIGTTERNLILNAMPTITSATTYATVTTEAYGTTSSAAVATTVTLDATYKPTFGTISWAESTGTTYVKTALGYGAGTAFFLTAKSKVTFTVPVTNATGATTNSIRVQFAGTDQTSATSPITTSFLVSAGTMQYTITATDSRGRSTVVTNGSIVVRQYTYPTVDKAEVYRANAGSTAYSPLGTYLRAIYKATASSVLALDGTTQKNWVRIRIDSRVKNTDPYVNKLSTAGTALTIPETTSAEYSGYITTNSYDIRFRVYDAFYDLDNDASTLEDTDDYSENIQTLPLGKVSLLLGGDYASIGKVHSGGTATLELGSGGLESDGPILLKEGKDLIIRASTSVSTDPGDIIFQNSSGTELQRIYYSGGYLYMRGTDGTGAYQIWNQQNLPFTQGTFTPRIDGATTAGVGTYVVQQGYYTKFGNMVLFSLALQTSAHTGTGNIKVMVPWTGVSTITQSVSLETNALTLTTGHVAYAEYRPGADYISIVSTLTGTTTLATINIDPACSIRMSGVIQIA